jgi:bacterioferritin
MKVSAKSSNNSTKGCVRTLPQVTGIFCMSRMCENWGYQKLGECIKIPSIGEMKHAQALTERILFVDGLPSMKPLEPTVGKNVQEMLQCDLDLEPTAVQDGNAAIQIAVAEKDNSSRDLLVQLLKDQEGHLDWLETQIHQHQRAGL